MQDFHLESIRLIVSRKGQLKSTGIFLSYIIVPIYEDKDTDNIPNERYTE